MSTSYDIGSVFKDRPFPCGLRGPVAADLRRPRFALPLETSPSRHLSAHCMLERSSPLLRSQIVTSKENVKKNVSLCCKRNIQVVVTNYDHL